MELIGEIVCDGCRDEIPKSKKPNKVQLNASDYDLCNACYQKLLEWFNREITI